MTVHVLGSVANQANLEIVAQWRALGIDVMLLPTGGADAVAVDDIVIGRLDVLPRLDGVEQGLAELRELERGGLCVVNRASGLLAVHDKHLTARCLRRASVPHPRTTLSRDGLLPPTLRPPLVLKPRFGSWGRDVFLCPDAAALERALKLVRCRPWFRRHGVLVQELIPPRGSDLRVLVAAGTLVGAARRVARPGEWRTNVSLGGSLLPTSAPEQAAALAIAAAAAVRIDFAGVDLVPLDDGGFLVLELNGAVEFDERYSLEGSDVYAAAAGALGLGAARPAARVLG